MHIKYQMYFNSASTDTNDGEQTFTVAYKLHTLACNYTSNPTTRNIWHKISLKLKLECPIPNLHLAVDFCVPAVFTSGVARNLQQGVRKAVLPLISPLLFSSSPFLSPPLPFLKSRPP